MHTRWNRRGSKPSWDVKRLLLPNRDHNQITYVNWNLERSHIWSQADHSILLWLIIVDVRLTKPLRVMNKAPKIAGICKLNIGLIFRLYGPFEASSFLLLLAKSNFLKRCFKRPVKAKILLISRFFLSCKIKQRCLLRLVSNIWHLTFPSNFSFSRWMYLWQRASMGLTVSRKTAKKNAVRRKKS